MTNYEKIKYRLNILILVVIIVTILQFIAGFIVSKTVEDNLKKDKQNELLNIYEEYLKLKYKEILNVILGYANWTEFSEKIRLNSFDDEDLASWLLGNNVDYCSIYKNGVFLIEGGKKNEKIGRYFQDRELLKKMHNIGSKNKDIINNNYYLYKDNLLIIFKIAPISDDGGNPLTDGIEIFAKVFDEELKNEFETFMRSNIEFSKESKNSYLLKINEVDFYDNVFYVLINPKENISGLIFRPIISFNIFQMVILFIVIVSFLLIIKHFATIYNNLQRKNMDILDLLEDVDNLKNGIFQIKSSFRNIIDRVNSLNVENKAIKDSVISFSNFINDKKEDVILVMGNMKKNIDNINVLFDSVENSINNSDIRELDISRIEKGIESLTIKSNNSVYISESLNDYNFQTKENIEILLSNIKEAYESSKTILQILNFIEEISEKTNLLSINASIEASHFGEAGKSFLIIAKEIRKLSSDIKLKITNISEHTNKIINAIKNTYENGEKVKTTIEKAVNLSFDNIDSINELDGLIKEQVEILEATISKLFLSVNVIKEINSELSGQKDISDSLINYFENIKAIIDDVGNVSEVTKKMTSSFERILPELNENVSVMEEKLNNVVDFITKFNLYKNN